MAAGALDPNGIWQFGEDDQRDTFSELLNIGQAATSNAVGADRARLAAIEQANLLGAVVANAFTPGSGWSITSQSSRRKNGIAYFDIVVSLTGAAITNSASGDIANQVVANTVAGWAPAAGMRYAASAGPTGFMVAGHLSAVGALTISAVVPGPSIPTGTPFSLIGSYPLA